MSSVNAVGQLLRMMCKLDQQKGETAVMLRGKFSTNILCQTVVGSLAAVLSTTSLLPSEAEAKLVTSRCITDKVEVHGTVGIYPSRTPNHWYVDILNSHAEVHHGNKFEDRNHEIKMFARGKGGVWGQVDDLGFNRDSDVGYEIHIPAMTIKKTFPEWVEVKFEYKFRLDGTSDTTCTMWFSADNLK